MPSTLTKIRWQTWRWALGILLVAGFAGGCSDTSPTASGSETPRRYPDRGVSDQDEHDARPDEDPTADTSPDPPPGDTTADTGDHPEPKAPEYALTPQPYTTLQRVWAPLDPSDSASRAISSGDLAVTDIDKYERYGLGVEKRPGQPWTEHNDLAPGYSGPVSGERRSLLYFWQSADPQLVDEESPIRFEGVTRAPVGSTYRPQDHLTTQVYESHVRTARRISEQSGRPFDFAFISGDMTDGGQTNEIGWTIQILNGGIVDPDSGVDDDPVVGQGNDFTDPFWSRGIGIPWYMAIGNHETLYTGVLGRTEEIQKAAVGNEVYEFTGEIPGSKNFDGIHNGFRDASTPTAEVVTSGTTPPDQDRRILPLPELLETIQRAGGRPDGHGMTLGDALDGKGYYSFHPLVGKPIRMIVLNTLQRQPAHASGGISHEQFEWLKNELHRAKTHDELVIVGGHHRIADFTRLSSVGGNEVRDLLASYENVILYLVGHGHHNAVAKVAPDDKRGYWELMCASTVDYPMQTRIFELVYDGDGYLSAYVTNIEQNAAPGAPAHQGRELAAARKIFMWGEVAEDWKKQQSASNLLLRYKVPADVAAELEASSWPRRIESLETLRNFPVPQ